MCGRSEAIKGMVNIILTFPDYAIDPGDCQADAGGKLPDCQYAPRPSFIESHPARMLGWRGGGLMLDVAPVFWEKLPGQSG